jgi:hypothetical protein
VIKNTKILRLFEYFSKINKDAYKNEFLLANDVLAKSPYIMNTLLLGCGAKETTFLFVIKKLILFYMKNLSWIFIQFLKKLIFIFSRQKFPIKKLNDKAVFIDTYFLADQIVKENCYKDPYFPGLTNVLDKLGAGYVYVPKLAKVSNLLVFYKMLRVLKRKKTPVLTEYQLLSMGDFLLLLRFVIAYPFYMISFVLTLDDTTEDRLAKFALCSFSGLSSATYFRLLYGKKISRLPVSKIKCISWYENQALDKCFYRGLRKASGEVLIYGAQLFIMPPAYLSMCVDDQEVRLGVVPDKVLVNGEYFLRKESEVDFQVGPALRYEKIFRSQMEPAKSEDILVLFPLWEYEISNILNCLQNIPCKGAIKIKFHPATKVKNYMGLIGENIQIVEGDIYSHFETARIVIGSATGALVEAASLGIPVINIENKGRFSHMYFPDFGRGVLWQSAATNAELLSLLGKFDYILENEAKKLAESALILREMLFCETTEEKIIEAFDLV